MRKVTSQYTLKYISYKTHNQPKPAKTTHKHPKPAKTTPNQPQPPKPVKTTQHHLKPAKTIHNNPKPATTTLSQQKPATTSSLSLSLSETIHYPVKKCHSHSNISYQTFEL